MSCIESNLMSFVSTIGFGGIAGFLVGFAFDLILFMNNKWAFAFVYQIIQIPGMLNYPFTDG